MFGVCDGHGGQNCVDYVIKKLRTNINNNVMHKIINKATHNNNNNNNNNSNTTNNNKRNLNFRTIKSIIVDAFKLTDHGFLSSNKNDSSGCTCCLAFIREIVVDNKNATTITTTPTTTTTENPNTNTTKGK